MKFATVIFFLLLATGSTAAASMTPPTGFDASRLGQSAIDIDADWRVEIGDSPVSADGKSPLWAQSEFDDSTWRIVPTGKTLAYLGLRGYRGLLWYRLRIQLPPQHGPMSLALLAVTSYQVFANGQMVGQFGGLPPHASAYQGGVFAYPLGEAARGNTVVIAIRLWAKTLTTTPGLVRAPGYLRTGARIGTADAIATEEYAIRSRTLWNPSFGSWLEGVLAFFIGIASVILFLLQRNRLEYLTLALWMLSYALADLCSVAVASGLLPIWAGFGIANPLFFLSMIAEIEFYFRFVGARLTRLVRGAQLLLLLSALTGVIFRYIRVFGFDLSNLPSLLLLIELPVITVAVLAFLSVWFIRGNREAGLLLIPSTLLHLAVILDTAGYAAFWFGWRRRETGFTPPLHLGPYEFAFSNICFYLVGISIAAILLYRFARVNRAQARATAEFEAARSVQQVLVPEKTPFVPGFSIATVYHPAQEVGGDFFQVIPTPDGVLISIGDVSGKGLQAAMIVSLIIGTLRTLLEYTQQPAELLGGLNRRLVGRTSGGFTTCLIAHLSGDGGLIIANAGHIPPYRNGEELVLPSELPLGIAPEAVYQETLLRLDAGDRLTFVSDGVVEAKNGDNELFGFERTRALSTQAAQSIADSAKQFGQQDDITVLTIQRSPLGVYVG